MSSTRASKNRHTEPLPNAACVARFRRALLHWWGTYRRDFPWRRSRATRFHQVVSEVLLQRTKAETVAAFWPAFITRFPNWQSIADTPVNEIELVLKPIGLSRQRAPRLKSLAIAIAKRRSRFPATRDEIEGLSGVGQYIANAIEMFCHGKSRPLIDVNMARLLERSFGPRKLADIRNDPFLQELAQKIVSGKDSKKINWAILDFAAKVCTIKTPECNICPFLSHCHYTRERTLWTQSKKPKPASH